MPKNEKKSNTEVKTSTEGIYTYLQDTTTVLDCGMFLSSVSTVQEDKIEEGVVVYEVKSISLGFDKEIQYWILLYDRLDNFIEIYKKAIYKGKVLYMTFEEPNMYLKDFIYGIKQIDFDEI